MVKTRLQLSKKDRRMLNIFLSVAAVVSHTFMLTTMLPSIEYAIAYHDQIIGNIAAAPYNNRVLIPYIAEGVIRLLAPAGRFGAFIGVYGTYYSFCIIFILFTLYFFLRQWFAREQCLVGVLFVAGVMPIAISNHYFHPWSFIEPILLTLALLAIYKKRFFWVGILVVIATLNRETGLMIVVAFAAASLDLPRLLKKRQLSLTRQELILMVVYSLLWLVIYGGVRWLRGPSVPIQTLPEILESNLSGPNLNMALINITFFLGIFWLFATKGLKQAPMFLRRVALIIPVYVIILIPFARWPEVRLLMPLYPILIGLALSYLYPPEDGEALNPEPD